MQLSLVVAFIPIVNILWCGVSAQDCHLADLFLQFGYPPECVVNSLASLLLRYKVPTTNECSLTEELVLKVKTVTNTLTAVKTLLQEAKSEPENATNTLSAIRAALGLENANPVKELPKNCADLRALGDELSGGVQTVYPYLQNPKPVVVFCDQVTDGGGWTVIQSRSPLPIRENFTRSWNEYVEGFGDPKGEFWIGLDNIHALTNSAQMLLRIDLEDAEGEKAWALYGTFHVGDAASEYVLRIANYSGNAGDGLIDPINNNNINGNDTKFSTQDNSSDFILFVKSLNLNEMKFSTYDNVNDLSVSSCVAIHKGGWWFNDCAVANLNGLPIVGWDPYREGITWIPFRDDYQSMKKATMSLRPISLGF